MWWQVILGVCAIFKCRFSNYCIGEYRGQEMSYQSAHTATRVFPWNLTHDCCQERRRLLQQRPQKPKWLESAICNAFCVLVFKLFGVQGIVVDIVLMCSAEIIGILWQSDLQVVFRFPFCWNFNFWFINPTYIKKPGPWVALSCHIVEALKKKHKAAKEEGWVPGAGTAVAMCIRAYPCLPIYKGKKFSSFLQLLNMVTFLICFHRFNKDVTAVWHSFSKWCSWIVFLWSSSGSRCTEKWYFWYDEDVDMSPLKRCHPKGSHLLCGRRRAPTGSRGKGHGWARVEMAIFQS